MGRSPHRFGRFFASMLLGAAIAWSLITLPGGISRASSPDSRQSLDPANSEPPDVIQPADTLQLTGLQSKFEEIARRVSPSVVSVSAAWTNPADADAAQHSAEMTPKKLEETLEKTTRTVGTGFVVDHGGFILTNEHVIAGYEEIWITTDDRKVMSAVVVGSDPRADLAILKVPTDALPPVTFGDCSTLSRGQWSIVLGNPLGLATEGEECMSVGVIAATNRSLPKLSSQQDRFYSNLIQTTAQINPGSSGGPLFDIDGKVIGIDTAVILPQKQTNGIGFAIPMTTGLQAEIHELERGEKITYAYLGATVTEPTARERMLAGLADDVGVRVESVEPQSPAAEAALKPGDLILRLDEQVVYDSGEFVRLAGSASLDKPAELQISRDGKETTTSITPRPRQARSDGVWLETQRLKWRGMVVQNIPSDWSGTGEKPPSGLLVCAMDPDSPMRKQGIEVGTIIATVAGRPVASVIDLLQLVNDLPAEQCVVGLASGAVVSK